MRTGSGLLEEHGESSTQTHWPAFAWASLLPAAAAAQLVVGMETGLQGCSRVYGGAAFVGERGKESRV